MAEGILAGVFTLAGVVVGVLLEPVKAAFANRARVRQERADRCAALLGAVSRSSTWLITLNRQLRDAAAGRAPALDPQTYDQVVAEFVAARQEMRKLVWLLRLSGQMMSLVGSRTPRVGLFDEKALCTWRSSSNGGRSSTALDSPAYVFAGPRSRAIPPEIY